MNLMKNNELNDSEPTEQQEFLPPPLWITRKTSSKPSATSPTQVGLDRFKELLGNPAMSDDETISATVSHRKVYESRNFKTQLAELVGTSEPSKKNEKEAWLKKARLKAGDDFDKLYKQHEIERAANTLYKMAFENLKDAPFGAKDRTFMMLMPIRPCKEFIKKS